MLNMMPWRQQQLIKANRILLTNMIFFSVLSVMVSCMAHSYQLQKLQNRTKEIKQLKAEIAKKSMIRQALATHYKNNIKLTEQSLPLQKVYLSLNALIYLLPLSSCLTTLQCEQQQLKIEGFTSSKDDSNLNHFFSKLAQMYQLRIADKKTEFRGENKKYFQARFQLKDKYAI